MRTEQVAHAYGRWAPIYDLVFGPVFRRGRHEACVAADRIGGRILEVGVGTGISLPDYSPSSTLYGVDISEPMLEKARKRVSRFRLANVEAIEVMDAEKLDFPDDAFDVVVAQYVVTAVPDPEKALDEFARVVRPGGEIVVTTRLGAEQGMRGAIEKGLMPFTSALGWRTEFAWSRYADWIESSPDIELVERRALPPLGHFSLLRMRKIDPGAGIAIGPHAPAKRRKAKVVS
jgi:phosphatidylethanolamine/phosphatidyl-N-methylethanolamine N-methyltransferase